MKELSKRGKRITAAVAAVVIGAAAVFGIGTAVRKTTSASVPVIQVSAINYGLWLDWENSVTGVITSDAEQSIYLSDTEKVKEVLVTEGQAVHKGDVLMKYDTKSTKLNLEKEKVNRERIELGIEVARENIRTLENISPISDGGDIFLPGDFLGIEAFTDTLKKAEVYKKTLKKDAKPANEDPEDLTLGTEDNPYLFLCEGDSVTITADFIRQWQRIAKKAKMKKLYIALQKRDKNMELQRAWMTDVMLLDPEYSLEVDLSTGQVGFASFNDEVRMAKLLKKILSDVPEDERAQWLAVMLDKLFIFTEREDESRERGKFFAQMIGELAREDRAEFAAAAALLDEETLSLLFKSLTPEQIEKVEEEASASILTMLLTNMTEEKIRAMDPEVLSAFVSKLTADQLTALDTDTLCAVLSALDEEQLTAVIEGLSDEKRQEIRAILQKYEEEHSQSEEGAGEEGGSGSGEGSEGGEGSGSGESGGSGNGDNSGSGSGGNGGESDGGSGSGNGGNSGENEGGSGSGNGGNGGNSEGSGGSGGSSGDHSGSGDSGDGHNSSGDNGSGSDETGSGETAGGEESGSGSEGNGNGPADAGTEGLDDTGRLSGGSMADGGAAPSTAPSPSISGGGQPGGGQSGGGQLISYDSEYTSDELAQAKREERQKLLDLELDLKESDIKIRQAQRAVDSGVVTAAMNGVVKSVSEPDAPPTDGSAFLVVAGAEGLYLKSGIKESMLGQVMEGDIVTVTSWQNGGQYEAEIKSISPYPDSSGMFDDSSSQTYYPFTASILDSNAVFESGEWVEVTYTASADSESISESDNTLTIMKAFVREEDNKKYVYIRGEDGKLKKQYVVTGTLSDSGYEILSGLSSTDWIAFPYGKNVKEGAKTREGSLEDLY